MDNKYIELFKELAHATTISAERVMDYDYDKGDETGFNSAKQLRDDFTELYDKINDGEFDGNLTRADFARLCVGALIMANQLQDKIVLFKKSLAGYQDDVIPKLQAILNETKTDEEAMIMANTSFVITEEK